MNLGVSLLSVNGMLVTPKHKIGQYTLVHQNGQRPQSCEKISTIEQVLVETKQQFKVYLIEWKTMGSRLTVDLHF